MTIIFTKGNLAGQRVPQPLDPEQRKALAEQVQKALHL